MNRNALNITASILGIISVLMIFVFPFIIPNIISIIPSYIYFIIFLLFLGVSNKAFEKTSTPLTPDEIRDEKIKKLLK